MTQEPTPPTEATTEPTIPSSPLPDSGLTEGQLAILGENLPLELIYGELAAIRAIVCRMDTKIAALETVVQRIVDETPQAAAKLQEQLSGTAVGRGILKALGF
jgi:hypothetical protein